MLTTVEGVHRDGKIQLAETPAGMEQARVLVTFLPGNVSTTEPQVLYGIWKDKIAADFDVDAALQEIRTEWAQERATDSHE